MIKLRLSLIGASISLLLCASSTAATDVWSQLYSPDPVAYAQNLRAAGAPTETVAVIVSHEVNRRFREREVALMPSTISAVSLREDYSPERRGALVQLRIEKNQLLRQALGAVPQEKAHFDWSPKVLQRLDVASRDAVIAIMDDYDAMLSRVMAEAHGYPLEEDREKLRFLEAERARDLGKILNEDEVLDFEIAVTSFGRATRSRLRYFEPTPEQLRTYLRLAKKNDLAYAPRPSSSDLLAAARQGLETDLAAAWDAETYVRYRRTTSAHYVPLRRLVERLKLDLEVADEIFDSTRRTTEEGWRLFHAVSPKSDDRRSRIAGFNSTVYVPMSTDPSDASAAKAQAEAYAKIKALAAQHCALAHSLLGDRGYDAYYDFAKGWIESMKKGGSVRLDFTMYQPASEPAAPETDAAKQ